MATITVTRCAGGNHVIFTITEAWGVHTMHFNASELLAAARAARVRSDTDLLEDVKAAVKQAGAVTPNQIKNAIEAATFTDTDNVPAARDVP